jgi:CheY-like chemotaxis protein
MLKPLLVMIVDDDPLVLQVSATVLERRGHRVIKRSSAIGTTVAISREQPDVVLLDVNMPGLSGDRLAKLVQPGGAGPVVILHSGIFVDELEELARACGAAGVIVKTGDPRQLVQQIEKLAGKRPSRPPAGAD